MEINSKPEELDVLDRKVMQLEIEIEAIKEKDETKLKTLGMDLANLKEDRNEIYAKWKSEKDVVDNIQVKTEIEDFKYEAERAEREGLWQSSRNSLWKNKRSPRASRYFE
jgi:ATP-dependent Clp protease ATP-binding subunit ClpB